MSVRTARKLRKTMTEPERKLWFELRDSRLDGIKFRRQHPLGPYVLDFFCEAHKLAVEVDGGDHVDRATADATRTAWLNAHGCRVLRFWNNDVMQNLPGVLETIRAALTAAPHPRALARLPLPKGEGK
jgi:very-short-patch-repair endonuclease